MTHHGEFKVAVTAVCQWENSKTGGREGEGEEERRGETEVRQEKKEGRESEILKQSRDGRQKIKNKCPKLETLTIFFANEREILEITMER